MGYKKLSTETLVALSAALLKDGEGNVRQTIEAIPETNGLLPAVERAHHGLLGAAARRPSLPAQIKALRTQLTDADALHDRKYRGIFKILEGLAEVTDTPQTAADAEALRLKLFERGLYGTRITRRDEAGAVQVVEEKLTDADRALLSSIPVMANEGSLGDHYGMLAESGKRMSLLEDDIARLQTPTDSASEDTTITQARNLWIRTVRALESALDLSDVTSDQLTHILGPIREAERKARVTTQPTQPTLPSPPLDA